MDQLTTAISKRFNTTGQDFVLLTDRTDSSESVFQTATPWFAGDCTMAGPNVQSSLTGPIITYRSDGTGSFDGTVRSSDSGDEINVWWDGRDVNGNKLCHTPMIQFMGRDVEAKFHFDISDAQVWKRVHFDFAYDKKLFGKITSIAYGFEG